MYVFLQAATAGSGPREAESLSGGSAPSPSSWAPSTSAPTWASSGGASARSPGRNTLSGEPPPCVGSFYTMAASLRSHVLWHRCLAMCSRPSLLRLSLFVHALVLLPSAWAASGERPENSRWEAAAGEYLRQLVTHHSSLFEFRYLGSKLWEAPSTSQWKVASIPALFGSLSEPHHEESSCHYRYLGSELREPENSQWKAAGVLVYTFDRSGELLMLLGRPDYSATAWDSKRRNTWNLLGELRSSDTAQWGCCWALHPAKPFHV